MDLCLCLLLFSCLILLLYIIFCLVKGGSHLEFKRVFTFHPGNMIVMSNPMERLRQLVGSNTWDYCVLWKISDDQRFLEFMDCCCAGTESSIENGGNVGGEEFMFPCRDVMMQHPRTRACELLAQFPSSHPLDGINMEILISNQPRWLNFSDVSDVSVTDVNVGTKVLIPIPGGLAELFAAKQVNEDQNVIDYVMAQCTSLMEEQEVMSNSTNNMGPTFSVDINTMNELQSNSNDISNQIRDQMININESKTIPFSPATAIETLNLSAACDSTTTADQIRLSNSSMSYLQQFTYAPDNNKSTRNDQFLEGSNELNSFKSMSENGFDELMNNANNMHNLHEPQHQGEEKSSIARQEMGRADSISDSDPHDEDDDPKYQRRTVKGPQSKNLVAERKRRKKLNERLYHLRSLVPNISKLDRASILGDAITYVQELQKEANDLKNELERNSDDEGPDHNNNMPDHHRHHLHHQKNFSSEVPNPISPMFGGDYDHEKPTNGFHMGASECLKRSSHDFETSNDKTQQMEVQVEVAQLEGNEFFVKVFGEQKKGGFVRLMEALNCLGLEITNVNMTSCISLVSYVFIVKKRDSEMVQADYLRDSLLEATRSQAGFWSEMAKASENGGGIDPLHQHQPRNHHHHHHHLHNHRISPFHNHFHHLN